MTDMTTKKAIRRNLPFTETYKIIGSFYSGGLMTNPAICDNCGALITNVAVIVNSKNQNFHVGMDCAETLQGLTDQNSFQEAKYNFRQVQNFKRKLQKSLKEREGSVLQVEMMPHNVRLAVVKDGRPFCAGTVDHEFFKKYFPEYKQFADKPEKIGYTPFKFEIDVTGGDKFEDLLKMNWRMDGLSSFSMNGFRVEVQEKQTDKGLEYEITTSKNGNLIGSTRSYMKGHIETRAQSLINTYLFEQYSNQEGIKTEEINTL